MSDSTNHLDQLTDQQLDKAATVNANFDAASPSMTFGRRATSTALTWAYYGGKILVDGVVTSISNGSVTLTGSTTNYVEASRAGVVSVNTTGFTPGAIPLYIVVTGVSSVTSYTDKRTGILPTEGHLQKSLGSPAAGITLIAEECLNQTIEIIGSLAGVIDVVVPLVAMTRTVYANTTGAGVRVVNVGSPQIGVTIGAGKTAIVRSSALGVYRVTADV